jgi:putative ABC transport system permease protein
MVINETLARTAFPDQNAIGKRIACCEPGPDSTPDYKEVIGVVADVRAQGLGRDPMPEFYLPMAQAPPGAWRWLDQTMTLVARSEADPLAVTAAVRQAVAAADPGLPVYDVGTMGDRITASLGQSRFSTVLLAVFGGIALLLAAVGVYGVISYGVAQRTQEIGIRMALGAQRRDVVRLVVRHGAELAAVGLALGLLATFGFTRLLATLLFRVSPTDPPSFTLGSLVLAGVALGAALLPARRASRLDPAVALRSE